MAISLCLCGHCCQLNNQHMAYNFRYIIDLLNKNGPMG